MSSVIPSFLSAPVSPSLPYDLWQVVVHETVIWIRVAGITAGMATFAASDSRLTTLFRRLGRFVPIAIILLPGVIAGCIVALKFDAAFEATFHMPAPDMGSYEIRCATWTLLPQLVIVMASRLVHHLRLLTKVANWFRVKGQQLLQLAKDL